jgi:cellulose synthase/poly-beta-1,6-N-acetylglucosamine synthase-like glycosyltransferase
MATFILVCHFGLLLMLCAYGWHRIHITQRYWKNSYRLARQDATAGDVLPHVTVQLPVFNERFVVERLIDAAVAIRYPSDRLEIQVLDDSTDETAELAAAKVRHYQARGLHIDHIRRPNRAGFKAGALAHGLASARGELVTIFDADFLPDPQVLMATVPLFRDPRVAMIQTRWDHLNREFSMFTQVQALLLDAHFIIEHGGRYASDLFFNFNGTGGIWRTEAIHDAGGWQADTLTEDLDLSYRAQLRGWRFVFCPDLTSSGELPVEISAFKSQQHRWAKGATQVMLKLLPRVWRAPIPIRKKIEATFHLSSNVACVLMAIDSIFFLAPSIVVRYQMGWQSSLLIDVPLIVFASLSHVAFLVAAQLALFRSTCQRTRYIPAVVSLGIGLALNNARAVVEALAGQPSDFVRTPKLGVTTAQAGCGSVPLKRRGSVPLKRRGSVPLRERGSVPLRERGRLPLRRRGRFPLDGTPFDGATAAPPGRGYGVTLARWEYLELGLGLLYTCCLVWAVSHGAWLSVPFLLLFQNGFLVTGLYSLIERRRQRAATAYGT